MDFRFFFLKKKTKYFIWLLSRNETELYENEMQKLYKCGWGKKTKDFARQRTEITCTHKDFIDRNFAHARVASSLTCSWACSCVYVQHTTAVQVIMGWWNSGCFSVLSFSHQLWFYSLQFMTSSLIFFSDYCTISHTHTYTHIEGCSKRSPNCSSSQKGNILLKKTVLFDTHFMLWYIHFSRCSFSISCSPANRPNFISRHL